MATHVVVVEDDQFRTRAAAIAALAGLMTIFGFVWPWIVRGLNAQLENLNDRENRGPQPINKERR